MYRIPTRYLVNVASSRLVSSDHVKQHPKISVDSENIFDSIFIGFSPRILSIKQI